VLHAPSRASTANPGRVPLKADEVLIATLWRAVVKTAMNHCVPLKVEEFVEDSSGCQLLKKDSAQ
jgi:hypothetical protein